MKANHDPIAELESRITQKDALMLEARKAEQRGETCSNRSLLIDVHALDESIRSLRAIIKAVEA